MPRAVDSAIRRQASLASRQAEKASANDRRIANIVPNTVRSLLGLVEDHGHRPGRLCKGLGFTDRDLHDRDLLLSYQQVRALILRARRLLDEPAMGLAAGTRQRPVSWGLTGLAMLTCETFGEAIGYGLSHQHEAGAMMQHVFAQQGREASIELVPHVFDLEIEPYLIEEAFAGALNVSRCMLGPDIRPRAVQLAFARSAPLEIYTRFFRCPVRFGAGRNRMTLDAKWLAARLPGYDRTTCGLLRQQLETLVQRPPSRDELVESIALRLRSDAERAPRQPELARQANCSERTL
ncbi:AraC family transcriptional regulator, partial [Xanthomonas phaseoli]